MINLGMTERQLLALDELMLRVQMGEALGASDEQTAAEIRALTDDKIRRVMARLEYAEKLKWQPKNG